MSKVVDYRRNYPILVFCDEDLENSGINSTVLSDEQFIGIAEALKYYYEEYLEEEGKGFMNCLQYVLRSSKFSDFFDQTLLEDSECPIHWVTDLYFNLEQCFALKTYQSDSESLKETGKLEIILNNGAYLSHTHIKHDVVFDTVDANYQIVVSNPEEESIVSKFS